MKYDKTLIEYQNTSKEHHKTLIENHRILKALIELDKTMFRLSIDFEKKSYNTMRTSKNIDN